jgi:hypothetical protein
MTDPVARTEAAVDVNEGPFPGAWWSIAAVIAGMSALVSSAMLLVTQWNSTDFDRTGAVERIAAFLSTLSSATFVLVLVAMFADRTPTRTWAFLGAAAYAASFVLRAALEQRGLSNFS